MVKYPALASEKSLPFSYDINHDVWHITYLLHSLTLCFSVFKGCTTSLSCPSRHTGFSAKRYVVLFWSSDASKSLNFKPILIHAYYVFLVWLLGLPPVMIPLSACLGHAFRSMCCKLPILTKTPSPQYIFYAAQTHSTPLIHLMMSSDDHDLQMSSSNSFSWDERHLPVLQLMSHSHTRTGNVSIASRFQWKNQVTQGLAAILSNPSLRFCKLIQAVVGS